jgi:predicted  nucleic acid-binding Zn-ribbon protein
MLPVIKQLLILQERDRAILQLRGEQQRIPAEVALQDKKLAEESARLESLKLKAKQTEADRKKLELDAESLRAQIVKYKLQQNQVKKNEEYQALTHQIEACEQAIREIEDRELDLMDAFERAQNEIRREQARLDELARLMQLEKTELQKRAAAIAEQLARAESERTALAQQIDAAVLSRYQRILDKRGDFAVVPIVHDHNCGGCHLNLPPATIHAAKSGRELAACDYCGRLLYVQP